MNKYLIILFFTVPVIRAETDNFKIFIPEFIPVGKTFQVSLQTSKFFEEAEKMNLFIIPGSSLILNKAELWLPDKKTNLEINPIYNTDFGKSAYRISLDLSTEYFSDKDTYFQVVFYFISTSSLPDEFFLSGEFNDKQNVLGYLENFNKENETDSENFFRYTIKSYNSNSLAGKCAFFNPNSSILYPLKFKTDSMLLIDFMIKHQSYSNQFLRLVDRQSRRVEFILELNEFQILRINSDHNKKLYLKPGFISNNTWYDILIAIPSDEPYVYFYCGKEEIAKLKLDNLADISQLDLEFVNPDAHHTFCLDQLRIINLKGNLEQIWKQRNYNEFLADSSSVLAQLDFSSNELSLIRDQSGITFSNIRLMNSDAPIFPRAPQINLKILNNYFEFTWTADENTNVLYYVLERAIGSGSFSEIARKIPDPEAHKTYSLITEKTENPEIVFYRLKQINNDKTEIFSDIVKIGLGFIEDVVLEQNYPNPFNPKTKIKFELIQDGNVEVKVFNLAGKEIALLHEGFLTKGIYEFEFDGSELSSGIYLYQVTTALSNQTRKMILAK